MNANACELLKRKIHESGLDSLLVVKHPNIRYLTGFYGGSGYAAVTPHENALFVNALFLEDAYATVGKHVTVHETGDDVFGLFGALGEPFWGTRIGYEADAVVCSFYRKFGDAVKSAETVPCEGYVEELRECKEPREIEAIRTAQRLSESVFRETLSLIREGVEEREIAWEIDYRLRKLGGERSSFDTIVAFGPNASKPHAAPSDRKLRPGDFVLIDMGTVVEGYASDMTRTLVFGKADARQREVYRAVLAAQEAVLERISSGMECADVDRIARDVLRNAGFKKEFIHSLGHGVGLEVHESPRLSRTSKAVLRNGSVVTVEPGVYIPGWGGVRIEDMVLVTERDCENLTEVEKELVEV
jgi:Xaa-Pro aminopeptidase